MKVAEKYGFDDIISSDVIRTEVSKRTGKAFALARLLSEGQLVPSAILVELIAAKMLQHVQDKEGFILSGFPWEKCEAKLFDKEVRRPNLVLMLNVRNSVMSDRLMAKSVKATERLSINFEYIKKQIEDFHKRNKLIVKYYRNLVVVIDAEPDTMTVFEKASESIDNILVEFSGFEVNRPATSNAARSRVTSK